jgi:hypothetical protein
MNSEQTEREAFEAWFSEGKWPKAVERSGDGYLLAQAQTAWNVWQARSALAQPAAPAEPAWRPIETAPKDGTEILLRKEERVTSGAWVEWTKTSSEFHGTTGEYLGQSEQDGGACWASWDGGFREDDEPTRWMPLPAASAAAAPPPPSPVVREALPPLPEPFWHAVVSDAAPVINRAIRREDVADEYADEYTRKWEYQDVRVEKLFTASQMHAYVLADRAARAAADQEALRDDPLWDHKGNVRHDAVDRLRERQKRARAAAEAVPPVPPAIHDALEWVRRMGGDSGHFVSGEACDDFANQLAALLSDPLAVLARIEQTLTIPAAEYVPAIGDVFLIIEEARRHYPARAAIPATPEQPAVTDEMVNRLLWWPLPRTFSPDCGISFDGRKDDEWNKNKTWPVGTNLFTAEEARAMLEHVLGGTK